MLDLKPRSCRISFSICGKAGDEKFVVSCLDNRRYCSLTRCLKNSNEPLSNAYCVGDVILGTFRLDYEDDYEQEFLYCARAFDRFGGRLFSKCACSELKPRTPI